MLPYQNFEVFASFIYYFGVKLINVARVWFIMFRNSTLTSIPENNENEDECGQKWVPKKKHEVLKAKYKCLKKLFQIYDANVIGFIPDPANQLNEETTKRRRKRSHRTKTDACAGTTEYSNGDITQYDSDKKTISTSRSETSTQVDHSSSKYENKTSENSFKTESSAKMCCDLENCVPMREYMFRRRPMYNAVVERRKLTRFQCFMQRLLGIRREYDIDQYAASDSYANKKRKRGLRFRRLRRSKKIKSETDLKDMKSPEIMSYVQSVQKSCLMDNTPRQCPILGCKMISYGIINYNDHLNLCHFNDRKYICHYCHEGFETEHEKFMHENEHIGLSKINPIYHTTPSKDSKIASITQTEPESVRSIPEEKLMKIVSFFDKIVADDSEKHGLKCEKHGQSVCFINSGVDSDCSDKRTMSCVNIGRKEVHKDSTQILQRYSSTRYNNPNNLSCHYCTENFPSRRQLSLHVDLEHRMHNRFSKFHSCAGVVNRHKRIDLISEDGQINIQSLKSCTEVTGDSLSETDTLTVEPSTDIVYCPSTDKKSSTSSGSKKIKGYYWEPETKIIRV